ncbi:unnamed protein product (macronuclear) [Paramecium tetraurelia]|uniref:Chromosome undetermined scaffold_1, whole genome shotgun sequence n=1 Tax=Paramecium tetraurelia TaxID=5888 RepID=Q6BFT3_PARTE|nr:Protein phosphatase [Paramecium tetraurelia strain d4-2]XP_001423176.1 uncharacterized protein GSPATT00000213001 [Paramecium tetraurelia]CAH03487.1 Protein phosphatase, putative [Paramecium tetraurelia]CAK55778.1 unnamed protein product [Paramecium tetraurelia]|eukprot:XP_001423176.1 hypothetical protein (macronuclear) [Paramecium tetraurelia strain d4-2]
MEYDYIGAIKIKDGLFLGDQFASQDLEFIVTNKVSRIVNCACKQIPNHWESIGIVYMSLPWIDNDTQVKLQDLINQVIKFMDDALNNGESVIVHSIRGHNRSIAVLCVYFMKKYRWTLYKTLQFMHSRRPDLEIRANFFNQLLAIETKFQKNGFGAKTYNWEEVFSQGDPEEMVLRNTYLNAQPQGVAEFKDHDQKPKTQKLRFAEKITMYIPPYEKIVFNKKKQTQPIETKSCLTGKTLQYEQQIQQSPRPQTNVMSQTQPLQPIQPVHQRPSSQDVKRVVVKSDSSKLQQLPEATQSLKPKKQANNFMDSGEQFFLKSQQKINQDANQGNPQNERRPLTAPNQLRAPRLQVTPYKKNSTGGQRQQELSIQANAQFKPMGNRQRAHSPNAVYNANPYVQKQFKTKPWKK